MHQELWKNWMKSLLYKSFFYASHLISASSWPTRLSGPRWRVAHDRVEGGGREQLRRCGGGEGDGYRNVTNKNMMQNNTGTSFYIFGVGQVDYIRPYIYQVIKKAVYLAQYPAK